MNCDVEKEQAFADAVWAALKADANDLRRQQRIVQAARDYIDETVGRCTHVLRGNLMAGAHTDARKQRDADIAILETMKEMEIER